MSTIDWNHIRGFHATAVAGSLSAAARHLGLTQPTLSRQVLALEADLGVTLFERRGRRLVLTQTGMELLENFRSNNVHLALVIDEYGEIQGLVTLQDVLEAITGEFQARNREDSWAVQREDGSWHQYYLAESIEQDKLDANTIAYIAAGVWHHWLLSCDLKFVESMWPTVERAIDFVLEGLAAQRKISRNDERGYTADKEQQTSRRQRREEPPTDDDDVQVPGGKKKRYYN